MAGYRLYKLGVDGRIRAAVDLDCASDADAIEASRSLPHPHGQELWQGNRKVAEIPSSDASEVAPDG